MRKKRKGSGQPGRKRPRRVSSHKTTGSEARQERKRQETYRRNQDVRSIAFAELGDLRRFEKKSGYFSKRFNFHGLKKEEYDFFWADTCAHFYGPDNVEKILAKGVRGPGIFAASWLAEKAGWEQVIKLAGRLRHKGKSVDFANILRGLGEPTRRPITVEDALRVYEEQNLRGLEVYPVVRGLVYGEDIVLKHLQEFREWKERIKKEIKSNPSIREMFKFWEIEMAEEILYKAEKERIAKRKKKKP